MLLTAFLAKVGVSHDWELANELNRSVGIDLRNSLLKANVRRNADGRLRVDFRTGNHRLKAVRRERHHGRRLEERLSPVEANNVRSYRTTEILAVLTISAIRSIATIGTRIALRTAFAISTRKSILTRSAVFTGRTLSTGKSILTRKPLLTTSAVDAVLSINTVLAGQARLTHKAREPFNLATNEAVGDSDLIGTQAISTIGTWRARATFALEGKASVRFGLAVDREAVRLFVKHIRKPFVFVAIVHNVGGVIRKHSDRSRLESRIHTVVPEPNQRFVERLDSNQTRVDHFGRILLHADTEVLFVELSVEEVDHFDPAVASPLLTDDGLVVSRTDVDVVGNGHLSRETVCASADALVVNEAVIKQWLSL